ncbi:MAG: hypothetical protein H0V94_03815 [Actinobacteria bacterium]|nr:hypothetical protein [Actinomycetota bacterium]
MDLVQSAASTKQVLVARSGFYGPTQVSPGSADSAFVQEITGMIVSGGGLLAILAIGRILF